ncbi:MAG: hypothetical protein AAB587_02035, partial [Patescibacteria group bacterium]
MKIITDIYTKNTYVLPITSAILLVLTFPPFNFWYLTFVVLVPFYIFLFKENSAKKVFIGGMLLGLIFSGYLSYSTISSFTWIGEAHLFTTLVKFLFIPVVALS